VPFAPGAVACRGGGSLGEGSPKIFSQLPGADLPPYSPTGAGIAKPDPGAPYSERFITFRECIAASNAEGVTLDVFDIDFFAGRLFDQRLIIKFTRVYLYSAVIFVNLNRIQSAC